MKLADVERMLRDHGCFIARQGKHTIWKNPLNGKRPGAAPSRDQGRNSSSDLQPVGHSAISIARHKMTPNFCIRPATVNDVSLILQFVKELAEYEKLSHEVTATEELLRDNLFSKRKTAEVVIGFEGDEPAGFALFFHNFSTFIGKPGIYLEDLFVRPKFRGRGYGKALMIHLAQIAKDRDCGRFEWWVLNWNTPSIEFYRSLGAKPMSEWTVQRLTRKEIDALANRH